MSEVLRRNLIIVLIAIIVVGGLAYILDDQTKTKRNQHEQNQMDSFMDHPKLTSYNSEGKIKDTFSSSCVTHFPLHDTSHAIKPIILNYAKKGPPWHITADLGTMTEGDNNVHLQGNVVIRQPAGENSHDVTFTTSSLNYYPNRQYAETKQPVQVVQPGTRIDGIGMTANLKTGEINLLNQSRGEYDPTAAKKQ